MKGTGAGGHSPRHDKLLDKDELKVDLDSTFGHHGTYRAALIMVNTYASHNTSKFFAFRRWKLKENPKQISDVKTGVSGEN